MQERQIQDFMHELKIIWNSLIRRDTLPIYADAIVVGGCRDLGLAEKAAELYHAGVTQKIIATGYQPSYMNVTEAQLLGDRCIELGVPVECIIMEHNAKNTGENIKLSAQIAAEARSVILIHKPYMSLRFLATAEAQWPNPQPKLYSTCQEITFEEYCKIHDIEKVAYAMLSDMKKIDDYAKLGYQSRQVISNEAKDSFNVLIERGIQIR